MSVTFGDLVTRTWSLLGGGNYAACEWSQTVIEGWLKSAIKDYSMRFPRGLTTTFEAVIGVFEYDLPLDMIYVRAVEYPEASSAKIPPYLVQKNFTEPGFWTNPFYDIIQNGSASTADKLIIGQIPTEAEDNIVVLYYGLHDTELIDTTVVTVPEYHHDALVLYALWQASVSRREKSLVDVPDNKVLFDRLQRNPFSLRLDYFTVLSQGQKAATGKDVAARDDWVPGWLKTVGDDSG